MLVAGRGRQQPAPPPAEEPPPSPRADWPLVAASSIWGNTVGVEVSGGFDGVVRDNVVELNDVGVVLGGDACGAVTDNTVRANATEGVERRKAFGAGSGESELHSNFGANSAMGPLLEESRARRLAAVGEWTGDVEPTRLKDSVRVAVTGDDERSVLVSG